MFVVTADQIASRSGPDLVPQAIALARGAALGFDRTVGDEVQAIYQDGDALIADVLALLRTGHWRVGIGAGVVAQPWPSTPRAGRGQAFVLARAAIEQAKRKGNPAVAILGANPTAAAAAQALIRLVDAIRGKRTAAGWAVYDLAATGMNGTQIGARLGISPQAVSDRAAAALLAVESEAIPALATLLHQAGTP